LIAHGAPRRNLEPSEPRPAGAILGLNAAVAPRAGFRRPIASLISLNIPCLPIARGVNLTSTKNT
jgi:hypothetical protein